MPQDSPTDESGPVFEQLLGKSWGDLEVLEHDGRLLFPEKIYKRNARGKFDGQDVLLRVPREPDLRWARVEARRMALDHEPPLDLDRDRDLVDNLESMCLLSRCMRDPKDPKVEFDPFPSHLESSWDKESLLQLYEKLDRLTQVIDPRPEEITEEQMIALAAAIVKERHILPLAVFGPAAQNTCIVYMAERLLISLASKSSSDSSEG